MTRDPDRDLQALLAEEPFVRGLACALAGSDSDDVTQQTFLMALQSGGAVRQPRSWLRRIATNVAANLARSERRRGERERGAAVRERVPSSAELMEREERRSALVRAVDRLSPELREVVLLRWFEGLPPPRVAAELGLPVSTVWNRLRTALQRLRERLDADHGGDRRAWLLPLLPLRTWPLEPAPALPVLMAGGWAMTTKTKTAVAFGLLLLLACAFTFWPEPAAVGPAPPQQDASVLTATGPAAPATHATVAETPAERELVPAAKAGAAATGSLLVRVVRGDDHTRAAHETLVLKPDGRDSPLDEQHHPTDAQGQVRIDSLAAGKLRLCLLQYPRNEVVEIKVGQVTEHELVVPAGVAVRGIVVDREERPIAGAEVDLFDFNSYSPATVTRSDADGRFAIRHVWPMSLIGARADGFAACRLQMLTSSEGGAAEVKLQLLETGGALEGIVFGTDGRPVPLCVVRVGLDPRSGPISSLGIDPVPVPVRTDSGGRFRLIGLKAGEQPVFVRAAGMAPWRGTCFIAEHACASLRVDLGLGATCKGIVRDELGAPLADVDVDAGDGKAFAHSGTQTAADGTFTLTSLAPGDIAVRASHQHLGQAKVIVTALPGATVSCEIVLSRGIELRGRVLDERGAPVQGVMVWARNDGGSSHGSTDAAGRFALVNCPKGLLILAAAVEGTSRTVEREQVDPGQGEVELRLPVGTPRLPPSVRVRGQVIGPDGRGVAHITVSVYTERGEDMVRNATAEDGTFTLGPVRPGRWQVYLLAQQFPSWASDWRDLAADAVWDLGRVQLVEGGTALVQVSGAPAGADLEFSIRARNGKLASGQWISERLLRSFVLAPGDYEIWFSCTGCARRPVPFTIRAGQETRVEAKLQPGIRQRIEYRRADGRKPDDVVHSLRCGDEVLIEDGTLVHWRGNPTYTADGALTTELWLAPGTYRLAARELDRGTTGSAEFTVATSEGPPVRIALQ